MKKNAFILVSLGAAAVLTVAAFMKNFGVSSQPPAEPNCLECHRSPNVHTNEGAIASQAFCLDCHGNAALSQRVSDDTNLSLLVAVNHLPQGAHARVACIACHDDVARSPHRASDTANCDGCHTVHGEKTAHAPHLRVDCQACHRNSPFVRLDATDSRVKLAHVDTAGRPLALTDHGLPDMEAAGEELCRRCHHPGNTVGAPAAVLPGKSALCIICHTAPLAFGHPIFVVAFAILGFGIFLTLRFWFTGSVKGEETSLHRKISLASEAVWATIFSRKIFSLVGVFFFDILLQRRILKESVQRWAMHSLIYTSIFLKFLLSIFTAVIFKLAPAAGLSVALIDKNNGFVAFTSDFLGLMILLGIAWAVAQRFIIKPSHVVTEIEDNITIGLLGLLVLLGFLLEGARIATTQIPPDMAGFAFIGYPLAEALSLAGVEWMSIYPALWYLHAVAGAAFVAYLPFGKLRHIFNVPLTYFLETVDGVKREQRI